MKWSISLSRETSKGQHIYIYLYLKTGDENYEKRDTKKSKSDKEIVKKKYKLSFILSVLINHLVNGWWPLKYLALLLGDYSHELLNCVVPFAL